MAISVSGAAVETHSTAITINATTVVTSTSFTPSAGDLLIVKVGTWSDLTTATAISGGSLTWTQQVVSTPTSNTSNVAVYTARVGASPASMTVAVSFHSTDASTAMAGFVVERWAGAALAGSPAHNVLVGSGASSSTLTSTVSGSVISWVDADFNGATGTPAYLSSATQSAFWQHVPNIGVYYAYQSTGTPGSQTYGMSAPTGQLASLAAVEIIPAITYAAAVSLSGTGTLTGAASHTAVTAVDFSGVATLTANPPGAQNAAFALSGVSTLTAAGTKTSASTKACLGFFVIPC